MKIFCFNQTKETPFKGVILKEGEDLSFQITNLFKETFQFQIMSQYGEEMENEEPDDFFIDVEFYGNGKLYGSDFGEVKYSDDENNIEFSWEFNVIEIMED